MRPVGRNWKHRRRRRIASLVSNAGCVIAHHRLSLRSGLTGAISLSMLRLSLLLLLTLSLLLLSFGNVIAVSESSPYSNGPAMKVKISAKNMPSSSSNIVTPLKQFNKKISLEYESKTETETGAMGAIQDWRSSEAQPPEIFDDETSLDGPEEIVIVRAGEQIELGCHAMGKDLEYNPVERKFRVVSSMLRQSNDNIIESPSSPSEVRDLNVTDSDSDDLVSLIFWFKNQHSSPIYTLDARHNQNNDGNNNHRGWHNSAHHHETGFNYLERAKHYSSRRLDMSVKEFPLLKLKISNLKPSDSGLYNCRVDFRRSPTRSQRIKLLVQEPIENLHLGFRLNEYQTSNNSILTRKTNLAYDGISLYEPKLWPIPKSTMHQQQLDRGRQNQHDLHINDDLVSQNPGPDANYPIISGLTEGQLVEFACLAQKGRPRAELEWLIRVPGLSDKLAEGQQQQQSTMQWQAELSVVDFSEFELAQSTSRHNSHKLRQQYTKRPLSAGNGPQLNADEPSRTNGYSSDNLALVKASISRRLHGSLIGCRAKQTLNVPIRELDGIGLVQNHQPGSPANIQASILRSSIHAGSHTNTNGLDQTHASSKGNYNPSQGRVSSADDHSSGAMSNHHYHERTNHQANSDIIFGPAGILHDFAQLGGESVLSLGTKSVYVGDDSTAYGSFAGNDPPHNNGDANNSNEPVTNSMSGYQQESQSGPTKPLFRKQHLHNQQPISDGARKPLTKYQSHVLRLTKWFRISLNVPPESIYVELVNSEIGLKSDVQIDADRKYNDEVRAPAFRVGDRAEFVCTASGSHPAASIQWYLDPETNKQPSPGDEGKEMLTGTSFSTKQNTNGAQTQTSVSSLVLASIDGSLHQRRLICEARNELLSSAQAKPLRKVIHLEVKTKPRVSLVEWKPAKWVKEKKKLRRYLKCLVKSNPSINQLVWLVNGQAKLEMNFTEKSKQKQPEESDQRYHQHRHSTLTNTQTRLPLPTDGHVKIAKVKQIKQDNNTSDDAGKWPAEDAQRPNEDPDESEVEPEEEQFADGSSRLKIAPLNSSRQDQMDSFVAKSPKVAVADEEDVKFAMNIDQALVAQTSLGEIELEASHYTLTVILPIKPVNETQEVDELQMEEAGTGLARKEPNADGVDRFQCRAINSIGEMTSEQLDLYRLNYLPKCAHLKQDDLMGDVIHSIPADSDRTQLNTANLTGNQKRKLIAKCLVDSHPVANRFRFGLVSLELLTNILQSRGHSIEQLHRNITLREDFYLIPSMDNTRTNTNFTSQIKLMAETNDPSWFGHTNQDDPPNGLLVCQAANLLGWQSSDVAAHSSDNWCIAGISTARNPDRNANDNDLNDDEHVNKNGNCSIRLKFAGQTKSAITETLLAEDKLDIFLECNLNAGLIMQLSIFNTKDGKMLGRYIFAKSRLIVRLNIDQGSEVDSIAFVRLLEFRIISTNLRRLSTSMTSFSGSDLITSMQQTHKDEDDNSSKGLDSINETALNNNNNKERHFRAPPIGGSLESPLAVQISRSTVSNINMDSSLIVDPITIGPNSDNNNSSNNKSQVYSSQTSRQHNAPFKLNGGREDFASIPAASGYEMNIYLAALGATLMLSLLTSTLIVLVICGRKRDERRSIEQAKQYLANKIDTVPTVKPTSPLSSNQVLEETTHTATATASGTGTGRSTTTLDIIKRDRKRSFSNDETIGYETKTVARRSSFVGSRVEATGKCSEIFYDRILSNTPNSLDNYHQHSMPPPQVDLLAPPKIFCSSNRSSPTITFKHQKQHQHHRPNQPQQHHPYIHTQQFADSDYAEQYLLPEVMGCTELQLFSSDLDASTASSGLSHAISIFHNPNCTCVNSLITDPQDHHHHHS